MDSNSLHTPSWSSASCISAWSSCCTFCRRPRVDLLKHQWWRTQQRQEICEQHEWQLKEVLKSCGKSRKGSKRGAMLSTLGHWQIAQLAKYRFAYSKWLPLTRFLPQLLLLFFSITLQSLSPTDTFFCYNEASHASDGSLTTILRGGVLSSTLLWHSARLLSQTWPWNSTLAGLTEAGGRCQPLQVRESKEIDSALLSSKSLRISVGQSFSWCHLNLFLIKI